MQESVVVVACGTATHIAHYCAAMCNSHIHGPAVVMPSPAAIHMAPVLSSNVQQQHTENCCSDALCSSYAHGPIVVMPSGKDNKGAICVAVTLGITTAGKCVAIAHGITTAGSCM